MMRVFFLMLLIFSGGCVTINSVSVSEVPASSENLISASDEDDGFFMMTVPKLDVVDQLRKKCPNGSVNGVQSRLLSRNFIVVQHYSLEATGYCSRK